MNQHWTFEKLSAAGKPVLEQILREGTAPDLTQLEGLSYCGYNHEPIGKLTGEKFKKGFFSRQGEVYGYNERVKQDGRRFKGTWLTKPSTEMGYFKICHVKDALQQPMFKPYQHLALFDYGVDQHKWHQSYFKLIRDVVALPNPGDHSLLLGKAFLQFSKDISIACCYFILGYPHPNSYAQVSKPINILSSIKGCNKNCKGCIRAMNGVNAQAM